MISASCVNLSARNGLEELVEEEGRVSVQRALRIDHRPIARPALKVVFSKGWGLERKRSTTSLHRRRLVTDVERKEGGLFRTSRMNSVPALCTRRKSYKRNPEKAPLYSYSEAMSRVSDMCSLFFQTRGEGVA